MVSCVTLLNSRYWEAPYKSVDSLCYNRYISLLITDYHLSLKCPYSPEQLCLCPTVSALIECLPRVETGGADGLLMPELEVLKVFIGWLAHRRSRSEVVPVAPRRPAEADRSQKNRHDALRCVRWEVIKRETRDVINLSRCQWNEEWNGMDSCTCVRVDGREKEFNRGKSSRALGTRRFPGDKSWKVRRVNSWREGVKSTQVFRKAFK